MADNKENPVNLIKDKALMDDNLMDGSEVHLSTSGEHCLRYMTETHGHDIDDAMAYRDMCDLMTQIDDLDNGDEEDVTTDSMKDMVYQNLMNRDILMEPLKYADERVRIMLADDVVSAKDREGLVKIQGSVLIALTILEKESQNKLKMMSMLEDLATTSHELSIIIDKYRYTGDQNVRPYERVTEDCRLI